MKVVRIEPLKDLSFWERERLRFAQKEAAACWNACVEKQQEAMRSGQMWPNLIELHKATKKKFALHSQIPQQIARAFLGAVATIRKLKKSGHPEARYPHKMKRFYPLMWPAQAMDVSEKKIVLPMGRGRKSLVLPRPKEMLDSGAASKIVWNGIGYELHWVLDVEEAQKATGENRATVDLGQIHQAAVTTTTGEALIVSGREIRAEKRATAKMHGKMARRQKRCVKYSKKWRRLQQARNSQAVRSKERIKDLRHKGTRAVIDFCQYQEVGTIYVGNPHGVRQRNCGRKQNQRMSLWEYGKDFDYLTQKSERAGIECFNGTERGTSSHCPECGHRHKPTGRVWKCKKCGFIGHRDVVGSFNMHELAFGQKPKFPEKITYLRPGQRSIWQAMGMKNPLLGSSSGLDTGHDDDHRHRVAESEHMVEPPGVTGRREPHGHPCACSSEAHPL